MYIQLLELINEFSKIAIKKLNIKINLFLSSLTNWKIRFLKRPYTIAKT